MVGNRSSSAPLDQWQWRSPLPQGNALRSVIFAGDRFVATGDAGTILTSTNAVNWSRQTTPTFDSIDAIAYGNGIYVAVGANGVNLTSPDGTNWSSHPSFTTNSLTAIAFGSTKFVAVDASYPYIGSIWISNDGSHWALVNSQTFQSFHGVTYADGKFVAVAGIDGGDIAWSSDGTNWTRAGYGGLQLNSVTYAYGTFVSVGANYYSGLATVATSANGVNWTNQYSGNSNFLTSVCSGDGYFEAVGTSGTILVSADNGVSWFDDRTPGVTSNYLYGVTFGNRTFVAVGQYGTILTKTIFTPWTKQTPSSSYTLYGVTYGNTQFVAVGGSGKVLVSSNGQNWTGTNVASAGSFDFHNVAFGKGLFAVVNDAGVLTSSNGLTWSVSTNRGGQSIIYGGEQFVVVGGYPTLLSSNGVNWKGVGPSYGIGGYVAYGNGIYVSVGYFSQAFTSPDGVTWTNYDYNPKIYVSSVAFGNGVFVAISYDGSTITSTDGVNWAHGIIGSGVFSWDVSFVNGMFVAPAGKHQLYTSEDGTNWTSHLFLADNLTFYDVAYGGGTCVAVGTGSAILQSADLRVPYLTGAPSVAGNGFAVSATGEVGRGYRLQASPDLATWSDVLFYTNAQYTMRWVDPGSPTNSQRFYRAGFQ
jgi:hypothetical protein